MHRIAALTLLLPTLALAQTTATPLQILYAGNAETHTFSPAECGGQIAVNWSYTGLTQQCGPLRLWVTSGSCGTAAAAGDYDLGSVTLPPTGPSTGSETIEFTRLPGFDDTLDGGASCGDAINESWKVCAHFKGNQPTGFTVCQQTTDVQADLPLEYDGIPPDPPVITDALGADEAIRVSAEVDGDTTVVQFAVRPESDPTPFAFGHDAIKQTASVERRIDGLVNGQSYEVAARAVDAAGNVSGESNIVVATPVRTAGFFETYKLAGGAETGGCSAAPGLFGAVASLLLAALISRRKQP